LPPAKVTATILPVLFPEFVAAALPPPVVAASISPVLFPVLVAVALPPPSVTASIWPVLVPEFVPVALPPPVVAIAKPTAVPELVVVAFWVPDTILSSKVVAFPVLVQVKSVAVVVQANCADAGELATSAKNNTKNDTKNNAEHIAAESVDAEQTIRVSEGAGFRKQCCFWKRRESANIILDRAKGKQCLRTKLFPHSGLPDSLNFFDNTRSCETLCSREHYEQNQGVSLFIRRLRRIHLIA
jgi:hypothetical protein